MCVFGGLEVLFCILKSRPSLDSFDIKKIPGVYLKANTMFFDRESEKWGQTAG